MAETNKYQYCIYNGGNLELSEIEEEFYQNEQSTREKYKDSLLCPGCQKVRLVIRESNNGIFLAAHPNSIHAQNCDYQLKKASKRELVEYYEQIETLQAEKLLEKALAERSKQVTISKTNTSTPKEDSEKIEFTLENNKGVRKYLPRRSLHLRQMEEAEHFVLYYGECKLFLVEQRKDQKNAVYYLRIFHNEGTGEYICDLKISSVVYAYLTEELSFIPRDNKLTWNNSKEKAVPAKIAFVSRMKKNKSFYNATLIKSDLIKVIPLTTTN